MPADAAQVATLARRLRGKGQDDATVRAGLKGLGFNQSQADRALADIGPSAAASPARSTAGGRPPAAPAAPVQPPGTGPAPSTPPTSTPSSSSGPSMPAFSAPDLSAITLTPPRRLNSTDLGGFLAGVFLYTLALNYLQYGPDGVKGWLSAKFLNKPMNIAAPSSGSGTGRGSRSTSKSSSSARPAGLTSTKVAKPANV